MKKFIVHTKPVPKLKNTGPIVVEVDCESVTPLEDPSVNWLPKGEFKVKILSPDFISESKDAAKTVYHSHSIYDSLEQAEVIARELIKYEFEFALKKHNISFTEEEIKSKYSEILIVRYGTNGKS